MTTRVLIVNLGEHPIRVSGVAALLGEVQDPVVKWDYDTLELAPTQSREVVVHSRKALCIEEVLKDNKAEPVLQQSRCT